MNPDLWTVRPSGGLPVEFLEMVADDTSGGSGPDPPPSLRLLLGACSVAADEGDVDTIEAIGDMVHERFLRLHYPAQVMRSILPYITGIYQHAFELAQGEQRDRLQIKALSMILVNDPPGDRQHELAVARTYAGLILGSRPPADYGEALTWMVETFPLLEDAVAVVAEHDCFLAHLFIQWMKAEIFNDFGMQARLPRVAERSRRIHEVNLRCLRQCAAVRKALGDASRQLDALELATYLQVLELRDVDGGRETAREAMTVGDGILFDLQLSSDADAAMTMGQRLFQLARFTGDAALIEERIALLCAHLRTKADSHFARTEWKEAAEAYSNLGYRYFDAGDLADSTVLYQLSMYFFEKAEFSRSRLPPESGADPDPHVYRRLEANAFIYASAARVTGTLAAAELFEDAADQLSQAATLLFQNMPTHIFYNSTAHYFLGQSELILASRSVAFERCRHHVVRAVAAFSECFQMFRNVYGAYQTLLRAAIRQEELDEGEVEETLARSGHPAPARAIEMAHACRSAEDYDTFRGTLEDLRRSLVYLNPVG